MLTLRYTAFCALILGLLLMPTIGAAHSSNNDVLLQQLHATVQEIDKIREPSDHRADLAEHLADLTKVISPKSVDDATLMHIESLLDIQDESVRFWVAASLGNLGPRAKCAVPKLLQVLTKVECINGALTSADAIRLALKRIGAKPPKTPEKCQRIGA